MIDKEGAHCDRCSNHVEKDGRKFQDLIEFIKSLGWRITKVGNIWLHYCADCAVTNQRRSPPVLQAKIPQWWEE